MQKTYEPSLWKALLPGQARCSRFRDKPDQARCSNFRDRPKRGENKSEHHFSPKTVLEQRLQLHLSRWNFGTRTHAVSNVCLASGEMLDISVPDRLRRMHVAALPALAPREVNGAFERLEICSMSSLAAAEPSPQINPKP